MKKILILTLALALAAIGLSSCSREQRDDKSEKEEIDIVEDVEKTEADDAKTEENGDEPLAVFSDSFNTAANTAGFDLEQIESDKWDSIDEEDANASYALDDYTLELLFSGDIRRVGCKTKAEDFGDEEIREKMLKTAAVAAVVMNQKDGADVEKYLTYLNQLLESGIVVYEDGLMFSVAAEEDSVTLEIVKQQ